MKNKIKYSIGIAITTIICYYSYSHPEKYHVIIPVLFGTLTVLGVALLFIDRK